ncbi:MAG: hypothetical protein QOD56_1171 [Gammaproteobacteria bacterium]|nr:hypothetical protein [Gammaproteobacteria bacterium]
MFVIAVFLAAPAVVRADLHGVVNSARLQSCRAPGSRAPLRDSPKLALAAARLANGQSLHASLAAVGYLAAQSSAVHVSGAGGDDELRRILAANYCATVADANLTDLGVQRRGRDVWLVFAAPVSVPGVNDAAVGRQILMLVNDARASGRRCGSKTYGSTAPLSLNSTLTRAALAHSQEMARTGEFEHRGHDGSSPAARVAGAGYGDYSVVGENIAAGAMTPAEVTQGWLASPAHCENIMDPRFTDMGIAFAVNLSGAELVYWTQDFAAPHHSAQAKPRARVNP